MSIINHLNSEIAVTLNALCKVTGLSMTQVALELVRLGGQVAVSENGVILAPIPVKVPQKRGPTAKVAPRLDTCREVLLEAASRPEGINALDLLKLSDDRFLYTDIMLVSKELLASGKIVESKKGRKSTWRIAEAS